ncbi:hypothetical protein ACJIZ3_012432 [Penstemon smallii]|uniref:Uncharacterized protein n=1 Tax=Penstemon smallii TaxID=265156 RepID=A0ABD3UMC2_9LAMI
MEVNSTIPISEPSFQIPFDLFVCKKRSTGFLTFSDSAGNLVYRVEKLNPKSTEFHHHHHHHRPHCIKLLLDSADNTLFSIHQVKKGSWKVFRGNEKEDKDLILKVERTLDELTRSEFEIEIVLLNEGSKLTMKGCPFKRSCTIYEGNSIVAESSLMYTLGIGKMFVPRSRFRVTIFPGTTDHGLIVSLIAIFFHGRKLWI